MLLQGDQVRLLILGYLIDRAGTAKHAEDEVGLRADQLAALRHLAATDLASLARMRDPAITVHMDPSALDHGLRALNHVRQRTKQIEYFISHGATVSMLVSLFRLAPADVAKYRTKLGLHAARRPPMPSAKRREAIAERWYALRSGEERDAPSVEDYRALHDAFDDLSLATLYAVVTEFAD